MPSRDRERAICLQTMEFLRGSASVPLLNAVISSEVLPRLVEAPRESPCCVCATPCGHELVLEDHLGLRETRVLCERCHQALTPFWVLWFGEGGDVRWAEGCVRLVGEDSL